MVTCSGTGRTHRHLPLAHCELGEGQEELAAPHEDRPLIDGLEQDVEVEAEVEHHEVLRAVKVAERGVLLVSELTVVRRQWCYRPC